MAGQTSRAVTIAAKFLGGDLIKKGAEEGATGIKKLGTSVKETDAAAGKSGAGWSFFSKKTDEAEKSAKRAGGSFHGMGKSLLSMGIGIGGGLLALSTIKSSIDSVGEKAQEIKQAEAIGIGENSKQTLSILAAYKARGIGMQQLGMTMKQLAKSSFTAEKQEGKASKASALAAEHRARQLEQYERRYAKWAATGKGPPPLPLAPPHEIAELGIKAKAYQSLGIVVSQFRKLTGTQQLEEVGEKLTKMPVGPERTRLATELLGRSATKLLPAFEKGEGSMKNMRKYSEEAFGSVGLGAKETEKYHVQMMKMNISMEAFKLQIGVFFLPIMAKLIQGFTKLYTSVVKGTGVWGPIERVVKKFVGAIVDTVNWFKRHESATKALIVVLGILAAAWGVEKVLKMVAAFKELLIVQKVTAVMSFFRDAMIGTEAVEAAAAAETVGLSGAFVTLQASALAILAPLAMVAAAVGGVIAVAEVASHLMGKGSFIDNAKELLAGHNGAYWEKQQEKNEDSGQAQNISALHRLTAARARHPHWRWEAAHHRKWPGMAEGGIVRHAGMAIVGEHGPEPVYLPGGAQVLPTSRISPSARPAGPGEASGDLILPIVLDRREIGRAVLKDFRMQNARA